MQVNAERWDTVMIGAPKKTRQPVQVGIARGYTAARTVIEFSR